jgi:hypothetical protein
MVMPAITPRIRVFDNGFTIGWRLLQSNYDFGLTPISEEVYSYAGCTPNEGLPHLCN